MTRVSANSCSEYVSFIFLKGEMNGLIKCKSLGRTSVEIIQLIVELFSLLGMVLSEQEKEGYRLAVCFSAGSLVGMCPFFTGKPVGFSLLPLLFCHFYSLDLYLC